MGMIVGCGGTNTFELFYPDGNLGNPVIVVKMWNATIGHIPPHLGYSSTDRGLATSGAFAKHSNRIPPLAEQARYGKSNAQLVSLGGIVS